MKFQKEYKKLYNHDLMIENMHNVLNHATEKELLYGKGWYKNANLFCFDLAQNYDITIIQAAGIVSAFSPLKLWEQNKKLAKTFIETEGNLSYHTPIQTQKAQQILFQNPSKNEVEIILKGYKTINFFNNILFPDSKEYVTIDRHHLYVCSGTDMQQCTMKQYNSIKESTIILANSVNLVPNQLQATLWLCWKRIKRKVIWERRKNLSNQEL